MPKMTYGESSTLMEVPAGWYTTKFLGTEARDPIRDSKFGKSESPRLGWLWEVTEGPHRGKKISQESGIRAGPRTTALRMLAGLSGGTIAVGQQVDTDTYIGKPYRVKVAINPESEKGNLYVADVEPCAAGGAAPAGGSTPAQPAAPPPRRQVATPAAPPAPPEASYWVETEPDAPAVKKTHSELEKWIRDNTMRPDQVPAVKDGESEWQTAAHYGFTDPVPF